ncbi:MAG: hypothetical protein JST93_02075 [Acidobacteria bacterium]|nr:hypothetical protein [Acidobacteriota bacterium]
MKSGSYTVPAIVCDADKLSQVAIIQNLGHLGVPVTAVAANPSAIGFASRYVNTRIVLEEPSYRAAYVRQLMEKASPGVLFYSNDANTENIARHRDELLANGFSVLVAATAVLDKVIQKDRLYQTAAECHVAVPRSIVVESAAQLLEAARDTGFPLILKSTNLAGGVYRFVASADEVGGVLHEMERVIGSEEYRHRDARLIAQEWIGQEDVELWNFNACVCAGKIAAYSMGRRIRSNRKPDGSIGSTLLYGRTAHNERILAANCRLLEHIRFDGIVETEWSQSISRPERIHLYDFNPRPSGNIRWALKSGAPLVEVYYRLALGLPFAPTPAMRTGVRYYKIFWKDTDFQEALSNPCLSRGQKAAILAVDLWGLIASRGHAIDIFDPWDLAPTACAMKPLLASVRRKMRWLFPDGAPHPDRRTGGVA